MVEIKQVLLYDGYKRKGKVIKLRQKNILWWIIGTVVVMIGIFLSWGIAENNFPSKIDKNTWLAFCGSYFGAVIGAVATLVVFIGTLRNNRTEMEKERYLQVLPVMSYKVKNAKKIIARERTISIFNTPMWEDRCFQIDLEITNIGLGSAQELILNDWHIKTDKGNMVFVDKVEKGILMKGEKTQCRYYLDFPLQEDYNEEIGVRRTFSLDVSYKDLFGNTYKQNVPFDFFYIECLNKKQEIEDKIDITVKGLKEAILVKNIK